MKDKSSIDTLYANPLASIDQFMFDESVASVFPDMIKRSVPGYTTILGMIGDLAERYAQTDSNCYDLGCSLGAATLAIRHRLRAANCDIIAVDNSQAMIDRCQTVVDADSHAASVTLHCADITQMPIRNASIVVLNFTLQFIPLADRQPLIERIYQGLRPGGLLILSEKIRYEDNAHQQLMTTLHHDFKRANGYSDLEIAQKRTALENVLQPETINTHNQRLKSAGFNSADAWFQCLNFASFIALKNE